MEIHGPIYDDAENYAIDLAKSTGMVDVSPYNDPLVMAGQGTIGLEILKDLPSVDAIFSTGEWRWITRRNLDRGQSLKTRFGNLWRESEACPVMAESLKQGQIVDVPMEEFIAEGLFGGVEKKSITFEPIQQLVTDILLVSEDEIRVAIHDLVEQHHQISEGGRRCWISGSYSVCREISTKASGNCCILGVISILIYSNQFYVKNNQDIFKV